MSHDYRDVLLKAASYVEQGWCQDVLALNFKGLAVSESDPAATKWCVIGAMGRAMDELETITEWESAVKALASVAGVDSWDIVEWNNANGRTADEVAQALRRAAE